MANAATQLISLQKTIGTSAASSLTRGQRAILNADGTYSVADATVRGDAVALQAIPVSTKGLGALMQSGTVPIISAVVNAVNDPAYSASAGRVTNISTSAVYIGKYLTVGGVNTYAIINLETVA